MCSQFVFYGRSCLLRGFVMAIRFFHSTCYSTHEASIASAMNADITITQPLGVSAYVEKDRGIAFNPDFDVADIFKVRHDLARSVAFYGDRLDKLDPVSFNYLNPHQRIACEEELLYTFYVVSAEYQLHLFEGSHQRVKKRLKQLQRCVNLLNALRSTPASGDSRSPQQSLNDALDDSVDKPAAYIGLTLIAPDIAETMLGMTAPEYFKSAQKAMSDANFYRLNWVWGGGLDRVLLDLIPSSVGRSRQAQKVFSDVAPVTGYMSWVLYYSRLGIELYLLTSYTFKNTWLDPFASEENKAIAIGIGERFKTQWELRKFSILNDVFWATANMACFFWLIGNGTLGYMGNALTGILLIFDLSLVAWGYQEKKTEHMKALSQLDTDILKLSESIRAEPDKIKKNVLQEHCDALIEARDQCQFDWEYAEKQWLHDAYYALGLFATFSLLCCFFFPPAGILPATVVILGVVGAGLSFLITIGAHAWEISTEIEKIQASNVKQERKIDDLKEKIELLRLDESPESALEIKRLELDIKHRTDELAHQTAMIDFRKKEIIQQTLSEALVPAVAFTILFFMPLGSGLMVLIPTIAVLLMSGKLLEQFEPKAPAAPDDTLPAPGLSCG